MKLRFRTILVLVLHLNIHFRAVFTANLILPLPDNDTKVDKLRSTDRTTVQLIRKKENRLGTGKYFLEGINKNDEVERDCSAREYARGYKCQDIGWEWIYQTCVYVSPVDERSSWRQARDACRSMKANSDLIMIPNTDFQKKLINLTETGAVPNFRNHWIGLSSEATPGNFTWLNGSVEKTWGSNVRDGCVKLRDKKWVSEDCDEVESFICQSIPDHSMYLDNIKIALVVKKVKLHERQRVVCEGHFPLDRPACLFWRWGNQTDQTFRKAACGNFSKATSLINTQLSKHKYYRRTTFGPCLRQTFTYFEFFVDYKEIYDGMKIKCCESAYNDSWFGYREAKCTQEKTMKVDDHVLLPEMYINGIISSSPIEPYVGEYREWMCSGTTHKDGVMTMGWANNHSKLVWATVFEEKMTESYGTEPKGLWRHMTYYFGEYRLIVVQYTVTFNWHFDQGHFVCWMRNASDEINTIITSSDKTAAWSRKVNMHYGLGKPRLEIEKNGLLITAKCSGAVSNYNNSRLKFGIYLADTYGEVFTIDYNKKAHDMIQYSDFTIKDIQVFKDREIGPVIVGVVEIRLPKFFKKGSVFCFTYDADRKKLFKTASYPPFLFHTYRNISNDDVVHDPRVTALAAARYSVYFVLVSFGAAGAFIWFTEHQKKKSSDPIHSFRQIN